MQYHKLKAGHKPNTYVMEGSYVTDDDILKMAKQLSRKRLAKGRTVNTPTEVKQHIRTLMHDKEHEVFAVLLLDNKHRVIGFHELFTGTIDAAAIYPREVVKLALKENAAAMILAHNHPSGDPSPSSADVAITERLKAALELVDVRVLDHIVVATEGIASLAELGKI